LSRLPFPLPSVKVSGAPSKSSNVLRELSDGALPSSVDSITIVFSS
jgi:hypothetical protein